ncbi:hypothetical protein ACVQK1_05550 [Edwardsiella tarda]
MEKSERIAVNTPEFQFDLYQIVNVHFIDKFGEVRGRAKYVNAENQYYICCYDADGRTNSSWFDESLLVAAGDERHPGCPIYAGIDLPDVVKVEVTAGLC